MSCGTAVGLPIGANILEGKGKGLFIATGTSMGFCCGSWTVGDGADTSAQTNNRHKEVFQVEAKESLIYSEIKDPSPTCKSGRDVSHG